MDNNTLYNKIKEILKNHDKSVEEVTVKHNSGYDSVYISTVVAFRIRLGKKNYIEIKSRYENFINDDFTTSKIKSQPDWVRIEIASEDDLLRLSKVILEVYENIREAVENFGCCHRFIECSDALKCVHPDKDRAKGCAYKENLENGRVFYGRNANSKH